MRLLFVAPLLLALAACTTPPKPSGFLTSYEGLTPRKNTLRAKLSERQDAEALKAVKTVRIEPTQIHPAAQADWLKDEERALLQREADAQLCFELSERYDIAKEGQGDARVRAALTDIEGTGRVASAASAAAGFFIPGPLGLRAPGSLGALAAEAEMLTPDGRQLAAITWARAATAVGTDDPSLSRIGDALQFLEPFADDAAKVMTAPKAKSRKIPDPDPCAEYGPRFRAAGWATGKITGLYVPEVNSAKPTDEAPKEPPPQK